MHKVVVNKLRNKAGDPSKFVDLIWTEPTVTGSRASLLLLGEHYRDLEIISYAKKYNVDIK